jgi:hypothetical protein
LLGGNIYKEVNIMAKRKNTKTPIVEQIDIPSTVEGEEDTVNPRILLMCDLSNKALEDGWLDANPAVVEKIIKMLPKPIVEHSKQRTYAIKKLESDAYKQSLQTGDPVKPITEVQISAEMDRMEKAKQLKASK